MKKHQRPRRILLTGFTGQVGWELARTLSPLGEVLTPSRGEFNLARPESLREKIRDWSPDLIVNPAAYTAVDQAETEYDLVFKINADAPGVLAEESERLNIPLIHYSTDYIFDGKKDGAYSEDDEPNPLNVYGESKLKGELAVRSVAKKNIILRTSWVYGVRGKNFLNTMLKLFQEQEELTVVVDQIGAPTWSRMIAEATAIIVGQLKVEQDDRWGLYHLTASGETSWHGFAEAIYELYRTDNQVKIGKVYSDQYTTESIRPMNSRLNSKKILAAFGVSLPDWDRSLRQCLS